MGTTRSQGYPVFGAERLQTWVGAASRLRVCPPASARNAVYCPAMKTSFAGWARPYWPWVLALALAGLLAACGANPKVAPAATATVPAISATPNAPTVTALPPSATTAAVAATSIVPATLAAQSTAPAATPLPAGPTATTAPAATATPDPAVAAILAYLDARARTDAATATGLSCKAWISKALTEVTSFRSMNAKLVGVTCQVNGSASGLTLVGCGGKMVTTYGTETRDWDLSSFVYQVTLEDGQWKMCGYH